MVRDVSIENVKLTHKDDQTGRQTVIQIQSLDLTADGMAAPLGFKAAGSFNGAAFNAEGQLGAPSALTGGTPYPV